MICPFAVDLMVCVFGFGLAKVVLCGIVEANLPFHSIVNVLFLCN